MNAKEGVAMALKSAIISPNNKERGVIDEQKQH